MGLSIGAVFCILVWHPDSVLSLKWSFADTVQELSDCSQWVADNCSFEYSYSYSDSGSNSGSGSGSPQMECGEPPASLKDSVI